MEPKDLDEQFEDNDGLPKNDPNPEQMDDVQTDVLFAVNLMGRGFAHSRRESFESFADSQDVAGVQAFLGKLARTNTLKSTVVWEEFKRGYESVGGE